MIRKTGVRVPNKTTRNLGKSVYEFEVNRKPNSVKAQMARNCERAGKPQLTIPDKLHSLL